ncbi:MAG: [protein-PII] uridylyltransferase [Myxococcota bacterium]|nr:[protein-PII] uridylyltransferase [Myxococcota bacterium]
MAAAPDIDLFLPPYEPGEARDDAARAASARNYLQELRGHLAALHRSSGSGRVVNEAHSDGIDRLIRRLYARAEARFFAEQGRLAGPAVVLAVGGYARRELSVGSDLDVLVIHGPEGAEGAAFLAERLQYTLWDAGADVGCAVRTIEETRELALDDLSAFTTILAARLLGGDAALFHAFNTMVRGLVADPEEIVSRVGQGMAERHAKYGASLYLLQPNLKETPGGLRDYHSAWWVARAMDPAVQGPRDFLHAGLLSESEAADYDAALDFFWRVRNGLHLLQLRKTDQLSFELQERLAGEMDYGTEGDETELPVEAFMSAYYRHARCIQTFSAIVVEQVMARVRPPVAATPPLQAEEGFRIVGDHLEIPHAAHLRERPVRLLVAFAVAQDHDVGLSRTARRIIRESLSLVDERFRADPEAFALLLRILSNEKRVMRTLMAMNEVGLLGAYLPEWDHIVCRWQHVIYHTYTVDVHSIFLVEELRRLWRGKHAERLPELTALVREAEDLPALYLGCLLHDIGKGLGGEHSRKGADIAQQMLERLGLEPERIERVIFVVRHHLLMSHVSQRRDLSDPKVIVDFARVVRDRENLHNLYLATYADMRASSEKAYSEWRAGLLRELFERTAEFLESGGDDPGRALEQVEARVETRRQQARRELESLGIGAPRIGAFFDMMPRRYFVSHTPRQIARHAMVVLSLGHQQAFATAVREMRGGFSEFILCAKDVHGLYCRVAGCLMAADINILGSNVYTTRTGLALEVYRVSTPAGGEAERRERWRQLDGYLARALEEEVPIAELLSTRRRPIGASRPPHATPPVVSVRNDVSDFYTVVDLTADDRIGLLYDLTHAITTLGHEVFISKATTVLDQVADTFYLKAPDQQRITDPDAIAELQSSLEAVVRGET